MAYVWIDNKIVPWEEATVHASSHALHYGDAVFEGIRFYDTAKGTVFFRIADHFRRMLASCGAIGLEVPYSENDLASACRMLAQKCGLRSGYIRALAMPDAGIGLRRTKAKAKTMIFCIEWKHDNKPVRLKISPYIRPHPKSTDIKAKYSGNYINCVLARQASAPDDALFLDYKGRIAESSGGNIFFVKNGVLHTPAPGTFFPGITRDTIIRLFPDTVETEIYPDGLKDFDESFITATATEITPVSMIGSIAFNKHSKAKIAQKKFDIIKESGN